MSNPLTKKGGDGKDKQLWLQVLVNHLTVWPTVWQLIDLLFINFKY